jgi:hypothetical protein
VAVDEARHGREAPAVDLLDVTRRQTQVPHASDSFDATVGAEHVRVLHDV